MENTKSQNNHDENKVDVNNRSEVEFLHQQWKQYTHEEILEAIKTHGPAIKDIEDHLLKNSTEE